MRTKQTQAATTAASVAYDAIDQLYFDTEVDNVERRVVYAFMQCRKAVRQEVLRLFATENPTIKDWIEMIVQEALAEEAEREKTQAEYLKSLKAQSQNETDGDDKSEFTLRSIV